MHLGPANNIQLRDNKGFTQFGIPPNKMIEKIVDSTCYKLSHIKLHKDRGTRLYCNTPTTDNAVKFIM